MHTINGHPAYFTGGQICYLNNRAKDVVRNSLDEIKAEQKATIKWREKHGFKTDNTKYGYRMFYV